jgi:hypothetical protein
MDGEYFFFSTQKGTAKYANLKRDSNISVIVNDPVAHSFVTAYGRAEIIEPERYPEISNTFLEKYVPAEMREQFAAAIKANEHSERILIVLKPEKIQGWSAPA